VYDERHATSLLAGMPFALPGSSWSTSNIPE
jgi:hypothetical protein